MESNAKLIRAITSEFVGRKLKPIALVGGIIVLIACTGALWLTTISPWWWLLATPIIILSIVALIIFMAIRLIIKKVRPEITKPQKSAVSDFVDKLERVSDNLQTPVFMIVFRMVRDIVRPRKKAFVQTVAEDSTTLHTDFFELQQKFR